MIEQEIIHPDKSWILTWPLRMSFFSPPLLNNLAQCLHKVGHFRISFCLWWLYKEVGSADIKQGRLLRTDSIILNPKRCMFEDHCKVLFPRIDSHVHSPLLPICSSFVSGVLPWWTATFISVHSFQKLFVEILECARCNTMRTSTVTQASLILAELLLYWKW